MGGITRVVAKVEPTTGLRVAAYNFIIRLRVVEWPGLERIGNRAKGVFVHKLYSSPPREKVEAGLYRIGGARRAKNQEGFVGDCAIVAAAVRSADRADRNTLDQLT